MKALFMVLALLSAVTWAQDNDDQDMEITNQQRCEEWAVMDGIAQEDLADYMKECLNSLEYEAGMEDESAE